MNDASILNPSIFFGSFELREPVTSVTDFLLALVAFYGFTVISKMRSDNWPAQPFYRAYFLMFAIGMTCAGWIGHGLQAYLSMEWKMIGWIFSLTGQACLAIATITDARELLGERFFKMTRGLIVGLFVIFLIWLAGPWRSFSVTQAANGTFAVAMVLPLQAFIYLKTQSKAHLIVVSAICFGLLPGIVFNQQISLNRWFNYHDISHVLLWGYMALMIFGIRNIPAYATQQTS